ncbi:polyhydroxybutyrate depolymerase [Corynebacterium sp. zg-331]|uniref:alpha/beta hydrolase family esterase n=1 Tax=unclassified Corynebacterium TaxID=2624378 RepID=UPI00128B3051|nr:MULTISPECIES: PHB depolymerase family esterase [unclassified Corynebacterium]MBC3185681.1 polyhydroxybutyrate depolymerase [Corynebacterium sp. zg-331]MPV52174.1 polyhydroxybutyrate depolymerase [Corynebacterium sp. zg331]
METHTLDYQGRTRRYHVVAPPHPTGHPDLLLYLHGSRQSGRISARFTGRTFEAVARRAGAILVYPDGVDHHFNDARRELDEQCRREAIDDVGFLRALVARFSPARVFACGYSNGGHMAMRLLLEAPGLLDAAAIFAATAPAPDNLLVSTDAYRPTPVLFMHGTADLIAPYAGGRVELAGAARGEMTSAPEGAAWWAGLNGHTGQPRVSRPSPNVTVNVWTDAAHPPVQLWVLRGVGHVVPSGKDVPEILGSSTDEIIGAEVAAGFFGLG